MRADTTTMSSGRTWVIGTVGGPTMRGYLPGWADDDPSQTDVSPEALHIALSDITHQAAIVDDWWIRDLDPDAVSETAARFRAFADLLDREVAPALTDAIAEWATHGTPVQIVNGSSG